MLMKVMRIAVAAATAAMTVIFVAVFFTAKIREDKTLPYISIDEGILEVSVKAEEKDLLKGVKASDAKDGDITERVLVESISKFSKKGYCKVNYAVSDSDNHVATATRQIHYTDYVSPKFKMVKPLVFSVYDPIDTSGTVGATDCLDGDISGNVVIYSPDYADGIEGTYSIQATVMNSMGDTSKITLPMVVEKQPRNSPEIILKEYLIYMEKGAAKNWAGYIKEKIDSNGMKSEFKVDIKTDFVPNVAGMYTVNYYGTDASGVTCHTALIVVAE